MRPAKLSDAERAAFRAIMTALQECGEPLRTRFGSTAEGVRWERVVACYMRSTPAPEGADEAERERHRYAARKRLDRLAMKLVMRQVIWIASPYVGRAYRPVADEDVRAAA